MQTLYLAAGIIGLVLIAVSLFSGGHDSDGDVHIEGHDVDGDGHWLPFFSLRFYTYFLAAFGAVGLLLTYWLKAGEPVALIASASTALATGLAVSYAIRLARKHEATSAVSENDLVGKEGQVLVPIRPGGIGRIRLVVRGDILDLMAVSDDPEVIDPGVGVLVVAVEGDRLRVVSRTSLGLDSAPPPCRSEQSASTPPPEPFRPR